MQITHPRYSKEDFAQRGDEIFERDIHPRLESAQEGHFVAIDIETSAYEIDADEMAASDRLRLRHSEAQIWVRQIGSRYARRFGPRHRSVNA